MLALTCAVLLGAGYVLFLALGRMPRLAPAIREAWPILHTETLIVGTVAGAFWLGGWVLTLALLLLAGRTAYEAASVAARRGLPVPPVAAGLALPLLCSVSAFLPMAILITVTLAGLAAGLALRAAGTVRGAPWLDFVLFPVLPLFLFTAAGVQGLVSVWLLAAFILVETFDSYALLGGKLFGRRRAFPSLSPNKTVEGLAAGAVMLMLTAALVGAALAGLPVLSSAAVALFVGALAVAGDLAASRLKRLSGVKDYPRVLPHQGGLLDIADAWIAAGAGLVAAVGLAGVA